MGDILLVDDDAELCALVGEYLGREGFRVHSVHDAESGIAAAMADGNWYDLAILDVMLPGMNGLDALRRLRQRLSIPVLMLTARGEEIDRIVGLELGADDYMAKPFHPRELTARIRAILRRSGDPETSPDAPLRVGDVVLDPSARSARRAGRALLLTSVEFDLLQSLLEEAGSVVSRDALSRRALKRGFEPLDRSIDMHVSNLRRKLEAEAGPRAEPMIKTVRNAGYLFVRPSPSPDISRRA